MGKHVVNTPVTITTKYVTELTVAGDNFIFGIPHFVGSPLCTENSHLKISGSIEAHSVIENLECTHDIKLVLFILF